MADIYKLKSLEFCSRFFSQANETPNTLRPNWKRGGDLTSGINLTSI